VVGYKQRRPIIGASDQAGEVFYERCQALLHARTVIDARDRPSLSRPMACAKQIRRRGWAKEALEPPLCVSWTISSHISMESAMNRRDSSVRLIFQTFYKARTDPFRQS